MSKKAKWQKPVNPDAIKVSVTAADIKVGKPKDEQCCPVALALNRAFGGMLEGSLSVCQSFVALKVTGEPTERTEQLPGEVVAFIRDFDEGTEVHPLEFELVTTRLKTPGLKLETKPKELLPENSSIKIEKVAIDNFSEN